MLGEIIFNPDLPREVRTERGEVCGLSTARVLIKKGGILEKARVRRGVKLLRRAGVKRVLTAEDFPYWSILQKFDLQPVDPLPFLRGCAAPLMLAALRGTGLEPERCTVALRGERADRRMELAARELCPRVRDVCVCVKQGGEALAHALRWEYGAAVRPDYPGVDGAIRFSPGRPESGTVLLDLFACEDPFHGMKIGLAGVELPERIETLSLISALWESNLVQKEQIKMT